jgi:hypothetical protein
VNYPRTLTLREKHRGDDFGRLSTK